MARKFTIQKQDVSVSQNFLNKQKNFVITKKIAKHGKQIIIVIPSALKEQIKPRMLAKITIDILDGK